MRKAYIECQPRGVRTRIASFVREGVGTPLLLLHGFGSTKEDFADLMHHPAFRGRRIVAYDAPGFGETKCDDLRAVSIAFLQRAAEYVIAHHELDGFHLVGHSMGGLTALLLAADRRHRVLSFTNIEGNLSSEDCFLSRQIVEHPARDPERFFAEFVERNRAAPAYSRALYAVSLECKVRPEVVPSVFHSMVDLSDNAGLLDEFVGLPMQKMFVYGSMNRSLTYLSILRRHGVRLAEIPQSGHFPMYANPPALWSSLDDFVRSVES